MVEVGTYVDGTPFDKRLTKGTTRLMVRNEKIREFYLEALKKAPNLQVLEIARNPVQRLDIGPLVYCPKLENLSIGAFEPIDLVPLANCPSLKSLSLYCHKWAMLDLTPLAAHPNLQSLSITGGAFAEVDLSPLNTCPQLSSFGIESAGVETLDLSPLRNATEMRALYVCAQSLQKLDIKPARHWLKLENVNIINTPIKSLDLSTLVKAPLRVLHLSSTGITHLDLTPLAHIETLERLVLHKIPKLYLEADYIMEPELIASPAVQAYVQNEACIPLKTRTQGQGIHRHMPKPDAQHPLSLYLLFAGHIVSDSKRIIQAIRGYHPSLALAEYTDCKTLNNLDYTLAGVKWGRHTVQITGFNTPMSGVVAEQSITGSHYPQGLKQRALKHQSHMLLSYIGDEPSPLEQYVVLATLAGALADLGALVVLNETAHTSFPATILAENGQNDNILDSLRTFPLLFLYCGFVKYEAQGVDGVWMRTYGAHVFGMPDLAVLAEGHHQGQMYFDIFNHIFDYLLSSNIQFKAGQTLHIEDKLMRLRRPREKEYFLESKGQMFVMDPISGEGERQ